MNLDQAGKDLIAAARYTEQYARRITSRVPTLHLLDCVSMSLGMPRTAIEPEPVYPKLNARARYHDCATRLFATIGPDLSDFTREGAIDALVAAAFWNVSQQEKMTAENQRIVPLIEELRIEAALVPHRRGKLYGLAAERINRLERLLLNVQGSANEGLSVKATHGEAIRRALADRHG